MAISSFDTDCIKKVRKQISNVKLRTECERCGAKETVKHLLWECSFSQLAWKNFNTIW